jgi:hypothetical protein
LHLAEGVEGAAESGVRPSNLEQGLAVLHLNPLPKANQNKVVARLNYLEKNLNKNVQYFVFI